MSKITLYRSPQPTRAARAHWAFLEAGLEFDSKLIDVFQGEQKSPEYLEVNPFGFVPGALFDGQPVTESSALVWIACSQSKTVNLIPAAGTPAWRSTMQWLIFAPAELDHLLATMTVNRLLRPPPERKSDRAKDAEEAFHSRALLLSKVLRKQPYLSGDSFTAADISVGYCMVWAKMLNLLQEHHFLGAYLERLQNRSAFKEVFGPKVEVFPDPYAS